MTTAFTLTEPESPQRSDLMQILDLTMDDVRAGRNWRVIGGDEILAKNLPLEALPIDLSTIFI